MSALGIGLISLAAMLVLMLLGVSVGSAMGLSAFVGTMLITSSTTALSKTGGIPFDTLNSYNFAVIPLFILMANIIATTGAGTALFEFFNRCVGRFRGGLAMATVMACAIFSAISSTPVATAITIGLIAIPEMRKANYSESLSRATIASGGTLGSLIPPSSIMIAYCIISQGSMTRLFIAGIIPGIILSLLMCAAIFIYCLIYPNAGPKGEKKYSFKETMSAFSKCGEVIILIALVLGGLFIGLFTPTEAGAVGAGGAIIITLVRKKLNWRNFVEAIKGTLEGCGMVNLILVGAFLINYLVAVSKISTSLVGFISGLNIGYKGVTVVIMFIYLILGCFLDSLAMVLLTMPIFYPLVTTLGADPYWFGIIITIAMQLGCITPPVGMTAFVVAGLDKRVGVEVVFKGVLPFIIAIVAITAILIAFPQLTTWLPDLIYHP